MSIETLEQEATLREVKFEKVIADNIEIMLSENISEPLDYSAAIKWCKNEGGRLPTIKELAALYNEGGSIRESFDGKILWSSSEYMDKVWAWDFSTGEKFLCSKTKKFAIANVADANFSDTANTRAVYIIE